MGDPDRTIEAVRTLDTAGPNDLSFLTNPRYRREAARSQAGALLTSKVLPGVDKDFLIAEEPYYALARLMEFLYPRHPASPGVHPTAIVEPGAKIAPQASIGPYSVVREGAEIASGVEIHSHVIVGGNCRVGRDSILYPRVVLYADSRIGERCILHAGVVVGSDGFGYAYHDDSHVKLEHGGRVVLEDDVEIGANSTVDRGLLGETRIGAGSKIDNLVQVAHNVRLGPRCLLISQSGIAGSSVLGQSVVLAGQAGVAGHLMLGDGVQVAAKSAGIPAVDAASWRRQQALLRRLGDLKKRLDRLEGSVGDLESEDDGDG